MQITDSTKHYYDGSDEHWQKAWEHLCAAFEMMGFKDMYYMIQKFNELEGHQSVYQLQPPTAEQFKELHKKRTTYLQAKKAEVR